MPKNNQTPGTELTRLLEKHGLNYNRLAKAIGLSSAMVRLVARDENPVSASIAFRLAKFFKTKPEYWMALQLEFDIIKAGKNKELAVEIKNIVTVDKATFERKKKTPKAGKDSPSKKAAAKKPAGKKPTAKKAVAKKPAEKKTAEKKPVVKKPVVKVADTPKAVEHKPIFREIPPPAPQRDVPPESDINEPEL